MNIPISERAKNLKQSGIRSASYRCQEIGGINLGQGICDLPVPDPILEQVHKVLDAGNNTYSACEGVLKLREALATKINDFNNIPVEIENIIIGHGSTGVYTCAAMTIFNPGDEVILFEPFYGYHKNVLELLGVSVKTVPISMENFAIDEDKLKASVTSKTKALVICTPCNPSGKVFTKSELLALGHFAKKNNLTIITDEMYEYFTYPGHEHVSLASLEDFKNFTITLSGFSKTYNMTGWRLGYASAPKEIIQKMALVQDYLYVCPVTPLQNAVVTTLQLPEHYYDDLKRSYLNKKNYMVSTLREMGFTVFEPQGAYYLMVDISHLGFETDEQAVNWLLENAKVATVSGRSFYLNPKDGYRYVRFCFALNQEKLEEAMEALKKAIKKRA